LLEFFIRVSSKVTQCKVFEARLDGIWKDQPVKFDYEENLRSGVWTQGILSCVQYTLVIMNGLCLVPVEVIYS